MFCADVCVDALSSCHQHHCTAAGVFVFAYAIYYYLYKSYMSGMLQASFFFGYMALACYALFLMLGTVGFQSSLLFVRAIYRTIKCDYSMSDCAIKCDSRRFNRPNHEQGFRKWA